MRDDAYIEQAVRLREVFNGRDEVPVSVVAGYLHRDYRNLLKDRTFPRKKVGRQYRVNVARLAGWMVRT